MPRARRNDFFHVLASNCIPSVSTTVLYFTAVASGIERLEDDEAVGLVVK